MTIDIHWQVLNINFTQSPRLLSVMDFDFFTSCFLQLVMYIPVDTFWSTINLYLYKFLEILYYVNYCNQNV